MNSQSRSHECGTYEEFRKAEEARTERVTKRFSNTYRGWSIALSIVRPVEEDYGISTRYEEGYEQALLDMCADGLISADDFEALEDAVQKRANLNKEIKNLRSQE
ncbi:hypothetical protein [Corynebacterium sp. CCUG 51687]|uniref:hypothetical protein n=1 Tax=Corynebacterium sp. CCUG 51687 TaxID=2823897 RepID=UPI0021094018|nr:hypothetical protein [Corynebacterium sp. CCUG 51687]MCQ4611864.1 hypothetical protein [Corynebacterium sp. CCUG 51687]